MGDDKGGRPAYDDDWYRARLDEMRPILCMGNSIRYSAERVGIGMHKDVLYRKYNQNDWFRDKVDEYRSRPGEMVNNTVISLLEAIHDKATKKQPIDRDDIEIIKLVAEKHRSAQPFFVSRTETAEAKPEEVGRILDTIENDYANVGRKIEGQSVAANPPVQDQKQAGGNSDVQTQPAANETPH